MGSAGDHAGSEVRDHLANERTYLAWVRTSITLIGLGFVVAKFELIVRSLVPSAPTSSYGLSSIIGVALVLSGGLLQFQALRAYTANQERIKTKTYVPSRGIESAITIGLLAIALLLAAYLILTI
jgi:putative membrane protein